MLQDQEISTALGRGKRRPSTARCPTSTSTRSTRRRSRFSIRRRTTGGAGGRRRSSRSWGRPGGRRSEGRRRRDRGGPRVDLLGSKRHVARSLRPMRASHPRRARGAAEPVRHPRLQRLRPVASGGRGRGGDGGDLLDPQPHKRGSLRPRPAPSGVVLASRLPRLRRQLPCGRRLRPRRFGGRRRARGGGRGSGVGVTRCFYRASLISYVAAFASYRRSGMSRSTRNTLSSAPSFSDLLPVARTIFTTVVPGVVEG
jgi:hypothetical protein